MKKLVSVALEKLKKEGLRITEQRRAILTVLASVDQPKSAEETFAILPEDSCDLVTAYRCLEQFEKVGVVERGVRENGTKVYEIWGPLFFGSSQSFNSKFDYKNDPEFIEIDFIESKVGDHSGIEALQNVTNKYLSLGKKVTLTHLSPECKTILLKANPTLDKIIESSIEDPRYHVVTDLLDSEV